MAKHIRNILFVMYDQLRFDYLSCAGHKTLHTPNFDRLANRGVRFDRCYVQSPVCGASRMSFYTGRYCHSHGAQWNGYPLRVGEHTMGDHLRKANMDCYLIGKTHMRADKEGMARLGMSETDTIGLRVSECGFDNIVREDGMLPEGPDGYYDERRSPYNEYLQQQGYTADNAWHDYANASVTDNGDIASGFLMKNADKPANIREHDSETPWLTRSAIDFMEQQSDERPWLAHLSYIKPHWPYIVPAPYHAMYTANDIQPLQRDASELENQHPVFAAFANNIIGKAFHREEVRNTVIPAYMGLIKQCDDQLGVLLDYLETSGRIDNTMVVLTSDHGDYLGDHWMGEKDLFHDVSARVPMIVYDPSPQADATRGTVSSELVESIDSCATFIEAAGSEVPDHIVEGKSLLPLLRDKPGVPIREFVISEYDYAVTPVAKKLGLSSGDCRLFMVADKRWKLMHAEGGFRPMLFDLENDPQELNDLGRGDDHSEIIEMMYQRLAQWSRRMSQRVTRSEQDIQNMKGKSRRRGILLGAYDENDLERELLVKYEGPSTASYLPDTDA